MRDAGGASNGAHDHNRAPPAINNHRDGEQTMSTVAELLPKPATDLAARLATLEAVPRRRQASACPTTRCSIILLSGDFDKAMAAFMMATGAVAMGMEVSMFFTFWGCTVIKKGRRTPGQEVHPQARST
ncbi:MAG: DsrE/DsrF/DrsH-like family protein [Desulfobacterales bacterium]|nr:DsrE/DsrF/DrsH-like family protein [Desulfobacterales bacterium]